MTDKTVRTPVLNSLIFIRDAELRDYPEIDGAAAVWRTESCVAVSCLPDSDGETTITLSTKGQSAPDLKTVFSGELSTPSGRLVVDVVPGKTILHTDVREGATRVMIFTNGAPDSDVVYISTN